MLSDGGYSNMQVLSKDGNLLVYSTFHSDIKTIVLADLNDTTENYLTTISLNTEANLEPDISFDNKKITYSSFDNNLKGTIRIFEDGKETALTKGLPSSNVPRFSPDAKKIAFVVIEGGGVNLISGGSVGTFQWIDNDRIIYDAGTESETSIGIVDINTGESKIIADGGFNLHPCIQK
jgi:Tol biopolymer transport system component